MGSLQDRNLCTQSGDYITPSYWSWCTGQEYTVWRLHYIFLLELVYRTGEHSLETTLHLPTGAGVQDRRTQSGDYITPSYWSWCTGQKHTVWRLHYTFPLELVYRTGVHSLETTLHLPTGAGVQDRRTQSGDYITHPYWSWCTGQENTVWRLHYTFLLELVYRTGEDSLETTLHLPTGAGVQDRRTQSGDYITPSYWSWCTGQEKTVWRLHYTFPLELVYRTGEHSLETTLHIPTGAGVQDRRTQSGDYFTPSYWSWCTGQEKTVWRLHYTFPLELVYRTGEHSLETTLHLPTGAGVQDRRRQSGDYITPSHWSWCTGQENTVWRLLYTSLLELVYRTGEHSLETTLHLPTGAGVQDRRTQSGDYFTHPYWSWCTGQEKTVWRLHYTFPLELVYRTGEHSLETTLHIPTGAGVQDRRTQSGDYITPSHWSWCTGQENTVWRLLYTSLLELVYRTGAHSLETTLHLPTGTHSLETTLHLPTGAHSLETTLHLPTGTHSLETTLHLPTGAHSLETTLHLPTGPGVQDRRTQSGDYITPPYWNTQSGDYITSSYWSTQSGDYITSSYWSTQSGDYITSSYWSWCRGQEHTVWRLHYTSLLEHTVWRLHYIFLLEHTVWRLHYIFLLEHTVWRLHYTFLLEHTVWRLHYIFLLEHTVWRLHYIFLLDLVYRTGEHSLETTLHLPTGPGVQDRRTQSGDYITPSYWSWCTGQENTVWRLHYTFLLELVYRTGEHSLETTLHLPTGAGVQDRRTQSGDYITPSYWSWCTGQENTVWRLHYTFLLELVYRTGEHSLETTLHLPTGAGVQDRSTQSGDYITPSYWSWCTGQENTVWRLHYPFLLELVYRTEAHSLETTLHLPTGAGVQDRSTQSGDYITPSYWSWCTGQENTVWRLHYTSLLELVYRTGEHSLETTLHLPTGAGVQDRRRQSGDYITPSHWSWCTGQENTVWRLHYTFLLELVYRTGEDSLETTLHLPTGAGVQDRSTQSGDYITPSYWSWCTGQENTVWRLHYTSLLELVYRTGEHSLETTLHLPTGAGVQDRRTQSGDYFTPSYWSTQSGDYITPPYWNTQSGDYITPSYWSTQSGDYITSSYWTWCTGQENTVWRLHYTFLLEHTVWRLHYTSLLEHTVWRLHYIFLLDLVYRTGEHSLETTLHLPTGAGVQDRRTQSGDYITPSYWSTQSGDYITSSYWSTQSGDYITSSYWTWCTGQENTVWRLHYTFLLELVYRTGEHSLETTLHIPTGAGVQDRRTQSGDYITPSYWSWCTGQENTVWRLHYTFLLELVYRTGEHSLETTLHLPTGAGVQDRRTQSGDYITPSYWSWCTGQEHTVWRLHYTFLLELVYRTGEHSLETTLHLPTGAGVQDRRTQSGDYITPSYWSWCTGQENTVWRLLYTFLLELVYRTGEHSLETTLHLPTGAGVQDRSTQQTNFSGA
ncbi:uncharacterized protein [Haliotis cracherodii]|uniref:uncharacterized protein n=1 Tax=Haliotis cracherodii TaxID=6455 RepID=UPI0039EC43F3